MGKWELTMNPVQPWGEEQEEGAVYSVSLHREPLAPQCPASPASPGPRHAFVHYRTCKVRRLKAATLARLVAQLLDPAGQEPDFSRVFLSTYRTFTSPAQLIETLFHRENATSDLHNSDRCNSPLLSVIQVWLEEYSEDFRDLPQQHAALCLLLDHLAVSAAVNGHIRSQPNFCSLAGQADALLKGFQREEADGGPVRTDGDRDGGSSAEEGSECEGSPADQGDIMDFSAPSIAEQLTRMDSELFGRVVPYQCLGCVWSQRDKKDNMSPTIRATVAQFNAVTNRVISSLLCPSGAPLPAVPPRGGPPPALLRARVVDKWIKVAQECRRLKNFSSLRAILSALQSNAVYRLRKTWSLVNRESMGIFENLCETFPDENCVLANREILLEDGGQPVDNISPEVSNRCPFPRQMSTSSGVVPYLGTYLTVLTMLDTALPDTVQDGLINFEKRRREFEILSQIRLLQAACSQYTLPSHPRIGAWLLGHKLLTDLESYELSRLLEPPVDPCSPGVWNSRSLTKKLSFFRSANDVSKKVLSDQISVSSSGSSGSEMEDLSSTDSACSIRLQSLSKSCSNVSEASSSSSSSCSSSPSSSSSPDSPPLSCSASSRSSQPDICSASLLARNSLDGGASPPPLLSVTHKRSVSMTALPLYNQQGADSCIIHVSVDLGKHNGNLYKSIVLTSQDKTAQVVQRALEKHHLEHMSFRDFSLSQIISQDRELLIPDKANVFYAMSTTANFDFVLRRNTTNHKTPLRPTASLGRYTK